MGSRNALIAAVAASGFVPQGAPAARARGVPLRWSAVILALVLWNLLLLTDAAAFGAQTGRLGMGTLVVLLFSAATAARTVPAFQRLVLKRDGMPAKSVRS